MCVRKASGGPIVRVNHGMIECNGLASCPPVVVVVVVVVAASSSAAAALTYKLSTRGHGASAATAFVGLSTLCEGHRLYRYTGSAEYVRALFPKAEAASNFWQTCKSERIALVTSLRS